ncbi:MAG: ABC transporter permease [Deltaproteobacteria bacterium]|nr:ABC transporter permease [Deltaproteobacteria bacterium]
MLASDLVQISLRQLVRNRRRYRGVILGIALGIGGLVTIFTLGDSVEADLGQNLELLGAATILRAGYEVHGAFRWHHGQYYQRDIEGLRKLPGVRSASPYVFATLKISHRSVSMDSPTWGVGEDFFETCFMPVAKGRRITREDVEARNSICVVGATVVKTLFDVDDPIGKEILVQGHALKIVGLIGGVEDKDMFESILIPISVARSRIPGMQEIKDIYVRAVNWDVVEGVREQMLGVLRANHPGYADAVMVRYWPDRIRSIRQIVWLVKLFVYVSVGVTLVLGGLGITIVMLAAVRERTTEIGLRKGMGATDRAIMTQFLVESVSISLAGAVIGLVIGFISVHVLKEAMSTVPAYGVFVASLVGGAVFGVVLGIVSGYVPARKASLLDPADAMRFE